MRYMMIMQAPETMSVGAAAGPPPEEVFEAMGRFNTDLVEAGVLLAAEGLAPSAEGFEVTHDGEAPTVTDGPFAEARELVAGFSIWEVKDMDEAVAWAKRCPNSMPGPSEIEIRPFYEAADLAEFLTPEELSTPREGERGKLGVA
jgi:hypothetical protein